MKQYTPEDIRRAILQYRIENNLTQSAFALLTGVSRETQNRLDNNKLSYLTPKTIRKLQLHKVIE